MSAWWFFFPFFSSCLILFSVVFFFFCYKNQHLDFVSLLVDLLFLDRQTDALIINVHIHQRGHRFEGGW